MTNLTPNGKAITIKKKFSRETAINIDIEADKKIIWALLTCAVDYPRWNSTVISIDERVSTGEKIQLKSTLDPKRVFNISIKEFETEYKLVWGEPMSKRIFELKTIGTGLTNFSMHEKIGGPFFPFFSKKIPEFNGTFEQFASDLKKEAEEIAKIKQRISIVSSTKETELKNMD